MPVGVTYVPRTTDPQLLTGTDIQAGALANLRKPESWTVSYTVQLRRTQRGRRWLVPGPHRPALVLRGDQPGPLTSDLNSAESHA